jgi:hypothetical protein
VGNSSGEGTTPPCGHPSRGGEFTFACLGGEFTLDGFGMRCQELDWWGTLLEKGPPRPAGTPPEEGNLRSLVWEGSLRSMVLGCDVRNWIGGELFWRRDHPALRAPLQRRGVYARWFWDAMSEIGLVGNSSGEGTTPPFGHPSRGGEFSLDGLSGEFTHKDGMCLFNLDGIYFLHDSVGFA